MFYFAISMATTGYKVTTKEGGFQQNNGAPSWYKSIADHC